MTMEAYKFSVRTCGGQLTDRIQCLSNDVINLEDKKRNLLNQLIIWNAQLSDLGNAIDIKNQQLKRMDKKML